MKILPVSLATLILSVLVLAACGGSGSGDTALQGSLGGTATKGPLRNATVAAYGVNSGQLGAQIAATATDVNGNFTMTIGSYAGPVMLRVSGGSYTDEATGTPMVMTPGDVMTAALPSIAAGATTGGVQVTPVTAMAQTMADQMPGGMTDANIAAANTAMGNYFSVSDILHTQPMNPMVAGAGAGASQEARNYGMTLAAMSQYARSLGMSTSSAMATAMMADAADRVMDGRSGAGPISMSMGGMMGTSMMASTAGTSGLAMAMSAFINSAANVSGATVSDMSPLVVKLTNATGQIQ